MHRMPLIPTEQAQAYADAFYGAAGGLISKVQNALATRKAYKAEPKLSVPIVAQESGVQYPQYGAPIYYGHIVKNVEVMAQRLAEASASTIKLGELLSEAEIKKGEKKPMGVFDGPDGLQRKMIVRTFQQAANAQDGTAPADFTLTKITLGPDPYKGRDRYASSNPFHGGWAKTELFTKLDVSEVAALIEQARAQVEATAGSTPSVAPSAAPAP